jgi:hypothetical protein
MSGQADVFGSLPAENCRTNQQQEGDKRRNRISRQAEKECCTVTAEDERPSGSNGDFPEL